MSSDRHREEEVRSVYKGPPQRTLVTQEQATHRFPSWKTRLVTRQNRLLSVQWEGQGQSGPASGWTVKASLVSSGHSLDVRSTGAMGKK